MRNKRKKYFNLTMLFAISWCAGCQVRSDEIFPNVETLMYTLEEDATAIKSDTPYCDESEGEGCGKVQAYLGVYKEEGKPIIMWDYSVINGDSCKLVELTTPEFSEIKVGVDDNRLPGEKICEFGVSTGIELRELDTGLHKEMFLVREWSCGTKQCTLSVSIGCYEDLLDRHSLLNYCEF